MVLKPSIGITRVQSRDVRKTEKRTCVLEIKRKEMCAICCCVMLFLCFGI